jgi:putative FmdB family regulatory protein
MPTYEYRCPDGHEFEKFQRMSEPPVAQCPGCGKEATRLLSGGVGLLFKGEGFYITDYRSDSYKKAAASDKPDGPKASGSKEGGSKESGAGAGSSSSGSGGSSGSTGAGKPDAGSSKPKGGSGSSSKESG